MTTSKHHPAIAEQVAAFHTARRSPDLTPAEKAKSMAEQLKLAVEKMAVERDEGGQG